jgi:hypothetical protein
MSGLPEVDMNDWEKNTTYANGYDAECPVIVVSKSDYSQLAILTADFSAVWGVLPLPRLRVSAPQLFSIVVVCIIVNLQLQLLKVAFHVV